MVKKKEDENKKARNVEELQEEVKPEQLLDRLHSVENRTAALITNFAGSMTFVYFHAIWFVIWILVNQGLLRPHILPFDPFPYGLLTMIVSLEAIFLSTFIMITQNRQALLETYRELEEEQEAEEAEEEVEDIQKDLEDIKNAMKFIQTKIGAVEKAQPIATVSPSSVAAPGKK